MSERASVLFDAPGPRTVARHKAYSVVGGLLLLALLGFVLWRLQAEGQLAGRLWEPFVTPVYLQALLVDGVLTTLQMAGTAIVGALVLGVLLGLGKLSDRAWVRWPSAAVVEFFRAVPLLLLMLFVFYLWGITRGSFGAYWSVVTGLVLYNGAVVAEIVRAGMGAVPAGQVEAAYALGLRKGAVVRLIQLPQAVKIMLPALISQFVVALKDTSLGYAVAAPGLTIVGRSIYQEFQNQVPTAIVLAAIYIVLNLALTALATWVQRRFTGEKDVVHVVTIDTMDGGSRTGFGRAPDVDLPKPKQ